MLFGVIALFVLEFGKLDYSIYHKIYDGFVGVGVLVSLFLYRIAPRFQRKKDGAGG